MERKLNYIYEELANLNKAIIKMAKSKDAKEQRALDSIRELAVAIKSVAGKTLKNQKGEEILGAEIDDQIAKSFRKELESMGPLNVKGQVIASTPEVTEKLQELSKLIKSLTEATEKIKIDLPETMQVTGYVKAKLEGYTLINPLPVILSDGAKAIDIEKLLIQVALAAAKGSTRIIQESATRSELDGYAISNIQKGTDKYFGFLNKDGAWYIMWIDSSLSVFYARGDSSYDTAWLNKGSQSYDLYNNVF